MNAKELFLSMDKENRAKFIKQLDTNFAKDCYFKAWCLENEFVPREETTDQYWDRFEQEGILEGA